MAASEAEIRTALTWESGEHPPQDRNTWAWLWEAIQGDFNDNRSTGQIAFDAAISMVPLVDQVCDVRDLIANCKGIAQSKEGEDDTWKWVGLALTLIGLFPSLGSLVKGVLKIFFLFLRKYGGGQTAKAVDDAMTWVITLIRKREVQKYLRVHKVDEVFKWLADQIRVVRGQVRAYALRTAFDKGISTLKGLLDKVTWMPVVGDKARKTLEQVQAVRKKADEMISPAIKPVQAMLDRIIWRLDYESALQRSGIVDAHNVHFRGTLPEARAITLMRTTEPLPSWLSKGTEVKWTEQDVKKGREIVARKNKGEDKWPELNDKNIASFHSMKAIEVKGPAKFYRVTSPGNGAMGDCWVPEDVWVNIMNSPDPKAAWRKYLAVWPDWNPDSQFVVMEVPAGQTIKAWRGPAASQVKDIKKNLDAHLEGGWDQVVFKVEKHEFDTTRYFMNSEAKLQPPGLTRAEWAALPEDKQAAYIGIREQINHPHIRGPFDTNWGVTDFDAQLNDARIGIPALPGQLTNR
ncbi:hypothetical protein [Chitinimonas sp. BJB300]|uniref:hypothetical protein n=1 Tax=Chitinimonas sp. BJB300 TaxID=1559339 RepID=UPI0016436330|nr:hypothetical protein [Chitinimonas sp. BJB300]